MAEEFQESEVIFQESVDQDEESTYEVRESRNNKGNRRKLMAMSKKSSVPVNIPENASRNTWFRHLDQSEFDDGDDGEMVPPHVIIGRRVARKMMAFSICTGNGRTLKGRGLSEFRNLILRMTGFLET